MHSISDSMSGCIDLWFNHVLQTRFKNAKCTFSQWDLCADGWLLMYQQVETSSFKWKCGKLNTLTNLSWFRKKWQTDNPVKRITFVPSVLRAHKWENSPKIKIWPFIISCAIPIAVLFWIEFNSIQHPRNIMTLFLKIQTVVNGLKWFYFCMTLQKDTHIY